MTIRATSRVVSGAALAAGLVLAGLGIPSSRAATVEPVVVLPQSGATVPLGYAAGDPALGADGTAFVPVSKVDGAESWSAFLLRRPGGSWQLIDEFEGSCGNHMREIVGDVDARGTVWIAWSCPNEDVGLRGVRVASLSASGTWSGPTRLSTDGVAAYDLDVNDAGQVAVIWRDFTGASGSTYVALRTGNGWQTAEPLGDGGNQTWPRVEVSPVGDVFALWSQDHDGSVSLDHYARVYRSKVWGQVLPLGDSVYHPAYRPDLTVSRSGNAVFSWLGGGRYLSSGGVLGDFDLELDVVNNAFVILGDGRVRRFRALGEDGPEYGIRSRIGDGTGTWADETIVDDTDMMITNRPDAVIDAAGNIVVVAEHAGGKQLWHISANGTITHTQDPISLAGMDESWVHPLAVNARGDGLVTGTYPDERNPEDVLVYGLDGTGPTTTIRALPVWTLGGRATVAWSDRDAWSTSNRTAVLGRTAGRATGFGAERQIGVTSVNQLAAALVPGQTWCARAIGTDGFGHVGAASSSTCTATPLDDRSLTASTGWTKRAGVRHYRGTIRDAKRYGATLRVPVAGKRFALVASTCRGCGTVKVYLGSTLLRRINLASSGARHQVVLPVATFATVRSGTLKVVVTSRGRLVRIDGVGVSRG